jgi:GntR family histidine utilization transcriptional repressor
VPDTARGTGDPTKYRQLAASLRAQISAGTYRPGDPVPTITELARASGWARQTCGRALRVLEGEGLLTFYPGLGYHVSPQQGQKPEAGCDG